MSSSHPPHVHESFKYVIVIVSVSVLALFVFAAMWTYSLPPFDRPTSGIPVVHTYNPVATSYINSVILKYANTSQKDFTKVDAFDENYSEVVSVVGLGLIPVLNDNTQRGFIPANYSDYL
jgi:hypothetical protein